MKSDHESDPQLAWDPESESLTRACENAGVETVPPAPAPAQRPPPRSPGVHSRQRRGIEWDMAGILLAAMAVGSCLFAGGVVFLNWLARFSGMPVFWVASGIPMAIGILALAVWLIDSRRHS